MCYIQPTNINSEHIACPKCKKQYVLCPCCGEPMEIQGQRTHPIPTYPLPTYPLPTYPVYPTHPVFPQQPWRPHQPFTSR